MFSPRWDRRFRVRSTQSSSLQLKLTKFTASVKAHRSQKRLKKEQNTSSHTLQIFSLGEFGTRKTMSLVAENRLFYMILWLPLGLQARSSSTRNT
jgi:hypothetical protein